MFRLRAQLSLLQLAAVQNYGSIAYEYEKNSYPLAMADVLWGNPSLGLDFLQQIDSESVETQGVKFFQGLPSRAKYESIFTLKTSLSLPIVSGCGRLCRGLQRLIR